MSLSFSPNLRPPSVVFRDFASRVVVAILGKDPLQGNRNVEERTEFEPCPPSHVVITTNQHPSNICYVQREVGFYLKNEEKLDMCPLSLLMAFLMIGHESVHADPVLPLRSI